MRSRSQAGDKVKVADDKSSVYVLIPGVDDKEEVTGPVISETTILSTGKSYTTTAPNRGDNFDDNGTKLTNGVKGLEDAGTKETAGWNNSDKSTANVVEVVVDLGASVLSNSYVVYIAGGNWGIGLPTEGTSVEVFASDSADSGFTSVAAAGKADMVLKSGDGEALNAWSTYTLTANAAAPVQARYIKFVITAEPIGNAFIWMDEVEVVAVKTESSSTVVKEEITVDGDLNDNGWAKDKWIVVDHETGYLQNTYEIQQGTAVAADFGYKYQLRTDDTKLYGAIVVDGAPVAGGNGKGTFPRLWIRDNDEATIYTHFFNIEFDADGNVITGAKYNTSTTENKGANIENSTFVAFAKEVDGKTVFEFSVDIKEFCADGTFDYFLSVSQLAGENYGCLYHPASEIGPTDPNGGANHIPHKYLPFNTWHTAKDATINVKDIALGEINLGNVIKEVVTVDGDVNDTGWAKKGWTTVSGDNGSWQYPTKKEVAAGTPIPTFTYKFQLRADDAKLYGALVLDGVHEEEKNIKVRIWFRDNDEATVYSSFYDFVFAPDGTLTTAAKYNTSTTTNAGANIENTTLEAVAKIVDGKTVFEFSVALEEVTKDGNFDYFVSLERKQGVNTGTLYFPFIPEKDETSPHGNYPWLFWMAENDASVEVKDIVLGEIVVSDKEEADTSMMGEAPADPAFTVTLDTEKGWVAGEKLVVTATVDVLKDGVDLSQIMFNLFYDAADVEIVLPEELGAIITSGKDSWKEDSLFTLSVDGEYGVIECAPATTVEADVLKKGDKLVMTFEFTVNDEAEGLINFQLSNKGLVGYSWDLDAAEVAGAGSSLAVANEDELGDTGIYVIAALALVALIGTAIVIKKRA